MSEPNTKQPRLSFLMSTLLWIFMIWGIPAIIMLIFAINGYLGRVD